MNKIKLGLNREELRFEKSWKERAEEFVLSGKIEKTIEKELFNYAWRATTKILINKLKIDGDDHILDAGCGWGRILIGIKSYLPTVRIDGVELTEEFVEIAINLLKNFHLSGGVKIVQGDLMSYDLGKCKYDSFYSTRVLHYIKDKELVLKKLYACLKKGSRGIVVLPNRYCIYRILTYRHAPLYSIFRVKKLMEKVGFKNVKSGGYGFIPNFVNFKSDSYICYLEDLINKMPGSEYLGGLAYAVGQK
jgi:ubiquinone/menaquinone biosynthesis C-methylase UbiE